MNPKVTRSGASVPHSGWYHNAGSHDHKVTLTLWQGETFPLCCHCSEPTVWELTALRR
ncbi:MAG TPA: hypothetical protein VI138_00090 [Candidatus Dormibacteraeota bacterium]